MANVMKNYDAIRPFDKGENMKLVGVFKTEADVKKGMENFCAVGESVKFKLIYDGDKQEYSLFDNSGEIIHYRNELAIMRANG